jgi:hypothetical protein
MHRMPRYHASSKGEGPAAKTLERKSSSRPIMLVCERMLPSRSVLIPVLGGGLLLPYLGFVAFLWWTMHLPPEQFGRTMAHMPAPVVFLLAPFETLWTEARAGTLAVGDAAPDFELDKLDKSGRIRLSELTSRQPVVLIFGSYT